MPAPTSLDHEDYEDHEVHDPAQPSEGPVASAWEWFRTMLQSFLVVYVTVLATAAAWFHGTTGILRLWSIPVLSVPVLHRLAFRPVSRRFAVRAMRRRRGLATFVGLVLGTAVLTVSIVIPDALRRSAATVLARHLGPVDELIVATSPEARLEALAAVERHEAQVVLEQRTGMNAIRGAIDAQLLLSATDVAVQVGSGASTQAEVLEFDLAEAARFGGDPAATGLAGTAPLNAGQVDVGADLADELGLVPGNVLTLKSGRYRSAFTVRRVLVRRGLAALTLDGTPNPRVVVVLPGAVSVDAAEAGARVRYVVAYSNRGASGDGWKRSGAVADVLEAALREPARDAGVAVPVSSLAAYAVAVKADLRTDSRSQLDMFDSPIRMLAGLSTAAAVLSLLVLVALATRTRRADVAALRSVGESRRDAVGATVLELWASLLAACLTGTLFGTFLARLLLDRTSFRVSGRSGGGALVALRPNVGTICTGLAGAFLVGMAGLYGATTVGSRSAASERLGHLRRRLAYRGSPAGVPVASTLPRPTRIWSSLAVPALVAIAVAACLLGISFGAAAAQGGQRDSRSRFGRFQVGTSSFSEPGVRGVRQSAGVKELTVVRTRPGIVGGEVGAPTAVTIGTLDQSYVASPGVARLSTRLSEFASDDLAFRATLAGAPFAIVSQRVVDRLARPGRSAVGSFVSVWDATMAHTVSVRVAGVLVDSAGLPDVIVSPMVFDGVRGDAPVVFGALLRVEVDESAALAAVRATGGFAEPLASRSEAEVASLSAGRLLMFLLGWLALLGALVLVAALIGASAPERDVEFALWRRYGATERWMARRLVMEQAPRVACGLLLGVVVAGCVARGFLRSGGSRHLAHAWFSPVAWVTVTLIAAVTAFASVAVPSLLLVRRRGSRGHVNAS